MWEYTYIVTMVTLLVISDRLRHTDAVPVTTDTRPVGDDFMIPCGAVSCDGTYQYCSTWYSRPQCLRCTGICAQNRVGNNKVAIQYCKDTCPEFWRRTHSTTATTTTTTTTRVPTETTTASKDPSGQDNSHTLVIIISGLVCLLFIITIVSIVVIFILWRRPFHNNKSQHHAIETTETGTAVDETSVHHMTTNTSNLNNTINSVQTSYTDTAVQTPFRIISAPSDDTSDGHIATHAGRSLPFLNMHNTHIVQDNGESNEENLPMINQEVIPMASKRNNTFPRLLIHTQGSRNTRFNPPAASSMITQSDEDTRVKLRVEQRSREHVPSGSRSSGEASASDLDLVSEAEEEQTRKNLEMSPLMGPDAQKSPSFRSH